MFRIDSLKQLGLPFFAHSHTAQQTRYGWHERRRAFARPRLETLEERCLLAGGLPYPSPSSTIGLIYDINAANRSSSPTTITLQAGATFKFTTPNIFSNENGENALPTITGNITIVGNGDTILRSTDQGTPAFRLFDVASGGSLTLQNLTLKNGLIDPGAGSPKGGAIYSSGTLNLSGVTVQSNKAVGTSDVLGSSRDGPVGRGGAGGGGIYVKNGTLTLTNDLIEANEAKGGFGENGTTFRYANSSVGHGGSAYGGGVYVTSGKPVTLVGDTFRSNYAQGSKGGTANPGSGSGTGGTGGNALGGGLYVGGSGPVTISADSFTNNKAIGGNGGKGADPTPSYKGSLGHVGNGGAGGYAQGGGLYGGAGGLTLNDDSISYNAAVGGNGGFGGATYDGLHCPSGKGGSASGGGVYSSVSLEHVNTLINTVISQDTVSGGTTWPSGGGGSGAANSPLIYGYAVTLPAGNSLPPGTVNTPYATQTISALPTNINTTPTLSYNLTSSPLGLNFRASGNQLTISGTPTASGTVTFTVTVTASVDPFGSPYDVTTQAQLYTLTINPLLPQSGSSTQPEPTPPSTLNVPPLLSFFNSLLGGTEKVNADGSETITDSLFGFPLLVATFDHSGKLVSVDLFGFNVTFLFG